MVGLGVLDVAVGEVAVVITLSLDVLIELTTLDVVSGNLDDVDFNMVAADDMPCAIDGHSRS